MNANLASKTMQLVLIVPLIGVWLMVHPEQSYACSCGESGSPSEELEWADAVFMGRAVSVSPIEEVSGGRTYVDSLMTEFDVSTVWKGPLNPTIYINSGADGASCGLAFKQGVEYIVYAYYGGRRDGLGTGYCTRTTSLSWAVADLAELGEGQTPLQPRFAPTSQAYDIPTVQPTSSLALQATSNPTPQATSAPTPVPVDTPVPGPTTTPTPQATNTPVPRGTATSGPGVTETGGGCSQSPTTIDLSAVGLLAGLAVFGLRRRRSQ